MNRKKESFKTKKVVCFFGNFLSGDGLGVRASGSTSKSTTPGGPPFNLLVRLCRCLAVRLSVLSGLRMRTARRGMGRRHRVKAATDTRRHRMSAEREHATLAKRTCGALAISCNWPPAAPAGDWDLFANDAIAQIQNKRALRPNWLVGVAQIFLAASDRVGRAAPARRAGRHGENKNALCALKKERFHPIFRPPTERTKRGDPYYRRLPQPRKLQCAPPTRRLPCAVPPRAPSSSR